MPSFFTFDQGTERFSFSSPNESSPLLGRFRAVPPSPTSPTHAPQLAYPQRSRRKSLLGFHIDGFGGTFGGRDEGDEGEVEGYDEDEGVAGLGIAGIGGLQRKVKVCGREMWDLWIEPKQGKVARVVDRWWMRCAVLVVLPALLAVAWCALPFPQYELPDDDDVEGLPSNIFGHKIPGHGEARVEINFWFFLFVYYGFYNIIALMWITKVFNIYSLNWWPKSLGFPLTVSIIAAMSIAAPIPFYCIPKLRYITSHNTAWICWTFFAMAMPLLVAFAILLNHERHLGLRIPLSETQRLFTSSWWTGDPDTINARDRPRRPNVIRNQSAFDPNASLEVALASDNIYRSRDSQRMLRKRWLPASFVRFMWFCAALLIAILTYLLGETYAEIYLRTLPHSTIETLVYVYSWVVTVHLLDGLCGWILGGNDGERVGSYPLAWIFKLYFALTYQTYVRALYARLRSPQQFIYLQIMSSSFLILLAPLTMSAQFHSLLTFLYLNGQSYTAYQKFCTRNIFLRGLSENVSMLTFLGSILVLHYGANKDVYPYFAFDIPIAPSNQTLSTAPFSLIDKIRLFPSIPRIPHGPVHLAPSRPGPQYDFRLTFYASVVTWACEIVAGWITRRILWFGWKMDVTGEGKRDLGSWPELLPTGVVVMVHVLQNMLFSIVRLAFH
ncbi:57d94a77-05a8-44f3-b5fe-a59f32bc72a7 [Sclerotinia trifoliorum]|uniref:57d94a77-05a8-44f3-b5fe-a59f32bc72a7 n=1 Tax=Sclerotinia trifoliorum TaxID=28548 RepID=A0A8H2VWM5_9HELO|nr:57d94a77-05a8-44f3-b5fe-a59f32bc72a7 [Sclerotinia trifoliorum]